MFKNNYILLVIIFFGQLIFAQEMDINNGFLLLEKGDFEEAETFFYDYLKVDPENKTAKLCYGRAVGLSGEPAKANAMFNALLKEYPGDFEIQINYNESFLWDKKYEEGGKNEIFCRREKNLLKNIQYTPVYYTD